MFDPTVYSLQSLVSTHASTPISRQVKQDSNQNKTSSSVERFIVNNIDPIKCSNNAILDIEQKSIDDTEDVESLSRKASTASEYTSFSDYTPENTVTPSLSPTLPMPMISLELSTNDNNAQSNVEELVNSQSSDIINVCHSISNTITSSTEENANISDATFLKDKLSTRKISRFFVSPATVASDVNNSSVENLPTLDVLENPKSEFGTAEEQFSHHILQSEQLRYVQQQHEQKKAEQNEEETRQQIQQHQQDKTVTNDNPYNQQIQWQTTESNMPVIDTAQHHLTENAVQLINSEILNDGIDSNIAQSVDITNQINKPLGPEHINTLEQLKIGLENITHAHVQMANKMKEVMLPVAAAVMQSTEIHQPLPNTRQISDDFNVVYNTGNVVGSGFEAYQQTILQGKETQLQYQLNDLYVDQQQYSDQQQTILPSNEIFYQQEPVQTLPLVQSVVSILHNQQSIISIDEQQHMKNQTFLQEPNQFSLRNQPQKPNLQHHQQNIQLQQQQQQLLQHQQQQQFQLLQQQHQPQQIQLLQHHQAPQLQDMYKNVPFSLQNQMHHQKETIPATLQSTGHIPIQQFIQSQPTKTTSLQQQFQQSVSEHAQHQPILNQYQSVPGSYASDSDQISIHDSQNTSVFNSRRTSADIVLDAAPLSVSLLSLHQVKSPQIGMNKGTDVSNVTNSQEFTDHFDRYVHVSFFIHY